jgi:hypothetical protein
MWEMYERITDQLTNIVVGQIIVALVRKFVAVILAMIQALNTVIHYAQLDSLCLIRDRFMHWLSYIWSETDCSVFNGKKN